MATFEYGLANFDSAQKALQSMAKHVPKINAANPGSVWVISPSTKKHVPYLDGNVKWGWYGMLKVQGESVA